MDCGYSLEPSRRGGSNEYPQSTFLNRNKKNNVYPCKPQFYYIKVGFEGVEFMEVCFRDDHLLRSACLNIEGKWGAYIIDIPRILLLVKTTRCHFFL